MAKEYCLRCIQTSANKRALPRIVKELTAAIARLIALADDVIWHIENVTRSMNELAQSTNILLIDDDQELGAMLMDFLAADHLTLTASNTGENGLQAFAQGEFDLLILDIMLPGISGLDVLKTIRQKSNVPVIMLTARGDDIDRIIGLEFGADDYLAKPFNPRELVARIKAILRRAKQGNNEHQQLSLGGINLNVRTRVATVADKALTLTGTEFEILKFLLEVPGEVVSKEQLSERALGRRLLPYDRSIDTHISNLRGKLEKAGNRNDTIQNQRGVGYLLVPGS
jgi:two-component system response regulator CpxR